MVGLQSSLRWTGEAVPLGIAAEGAPLAEAPEAEAAPAEGAEGAEGAVSAGPSRTRRQWTCPCLLQRAAVDPHRAAAEGVVRAAAVVDEEEAEEPLVATHR